MTARRSPRGRLLACALLLLAAAGRALAEGAGGATALAFRLEQLEAGSGYLWTDFSLEHALEGRTRDDLRHGRPLTFVYTVELWRKRAHWFDSLVASRALEVRVRYDPWQEIYAVAGLGTEIREYLTLEEAQAGVSQHLHVRTSRLDRMKADGEYYVNLRVNIKTLTLHDLREVEGWLKGEVRPESDGGGSLSLPRSFMRMVLGVSGLGDRTAMLRSDSFAGARLGLGS